MGKSRLDSGLLRKLSKKTGKSEKYLREQISKRASRKGVSSEAYFVYWLTREGIHSAIYQRLLPADTRTEIRELLQNARMFSRPPTRKQKIQSVRKDFKVKKPSIRPKPSLISQELVKHAQQNAEIYPVLFIFENSVRCFVKKVLESKYGKNWWKSRITRKISDKVAQRMKTEKMNRWHGARGAHEIYYTDFSELSIIIKQNAGDFNDYFKRIQGGTNWLTQKLDELALSRHNIAHVCPLQVKDRERFLLYFKDWYEQLDNLNKKIS